MSKVRHIYNMIRSDGIVSGIISGVLLIGLIAVFKYAVGLTLQNWTMLTAVIALLMASVSLCLFLIRRTPPSLADELQSPNGPVSQIIDGLVKQAIATTSQNREPKEPAPLPLKLSDFTVEEAILLVLMGLENERAELLAADYNQGRETPRHLSVGTRGLFKDDDPRVALRFITAKDGLLTKRAITLDGADCYGNNHFGPFARH